MNNAMIRYILGQVLRIEGILMLLPCIVAVIYREKEGFVILGVAVLCFFSRNAGDHPQAKKPRFLFKRRLCGDGVKLDHHEYFRQSAILSDRNGADFCGRHV